MSIVKEKIKQPLNKETIESIQKIRESYLNITRDIGEITIRKKQVESEEAQLFNEYDKIKAAETTIVKELIDKYGQGVIDPSDWTYEPNKSEK